MILDYSRRNFSFYEEIIVPAHARNSPISTPVCEIETLPDCYGRLKKWEETRCANPAPRNKTQDTRHKNRGPGSRGRQPDDMVFQYGGKRQIVIPLPSGRYCATARRESTSSTQPHGTRRDSIQKSNRPLPAVQVAITATSITHLRHALLRQEPNVPVGVAERSHRVL